MGMCSEMANIDLDVNDILLPIAEDVLTTLFERITQSESVSVSKLIYSTLAQYRHLHSTL
jgi:hypothetical protein